MAAEYFLFFIGYRPEQRPFALGRIFYLLFLLFDLLRPAYLLFRGKL